MRKILFYQSALDSLKMFKTANQKLVFKVFDSSLTYKKILLQELENLNHLNLILAAIGLEESMMNIV